MRNIFEHGLLKKKINTFKSKIYKINIVIRNLRFDLPKKRKYLIIDKRSKDLQQIFNISKESTILSIRNEEFYFFIIFYSFVKFKLLAISDFYTFYIKAFIEYVSPNILLTYIHNNKRLWRISEGKNLRLLIFQNGYVGPSAINPIKRNTSKDSIFFTLTKERAEIYKTNGVKAIPFGSVQSNSVPIKKSKVDKKNILFISQFRNINEKKIDDKNNYLENLSFDQCYYYDKELFRISKEFAKDYNLKLQILGMSNTNSNLKFERKFFSLENEEINLIKKCKNLKEKFKLIDESFMVIGIDSALLYESLGRGKSTFFCTCRGFNEFGKSVRPFLNSTINKKNGRFWTNVFDEKLIYSLLKKIYFEKELKSANSNDSDLKQVPYYNPLNLKLIKKIIEDENNF